VDDFHRAPPSRPSASATIAERDKEFQARARACSIHRRNLAQTAGALSLSTLVMVGW
jgi:hypothetical protein